jgi:hypothetical protein
MKKRSMCLLLFLVATLSFFDVRSAKADWHVAAVQCEGGHNRILVRFGMNGGSYSEIPDSLSAQWRDVPTQEDGYFAGSECTFKDGQKISVSESADQETSGMDGDDINEFFKMAIDGHIVYDEKQVYQGHKIYSDYDISAVEYNGRSLLECNPRETYNGMGRISADPTCYDASARLSPGEKFLSGQEKSTSKDERDNPGSYYLPTPTVPPDPSLALKSPIEFGEYTIVGIDLAGIRKPLKSSLVGEKAVIGPLVVPAIIYPNKPYHPVIMRRSEGKIIGPTKTLSIQDEEKALNVSANWLTNLAPGVTTVTDTYLECDPQSQSQMHLVILTRTLGINIELEKMFLAVRHD